MASVRTLVRDAHDDERQDRDPGVGQPGLGKGFRLVDMPLAIALAMHPRGVAPPFRIGGRR